MNEKYVYIYIGSDHKIGIADAIVQMAYLQIHFALIFKEKFLLAKIKRTKILVYIYLNKEKNIYSKNKTSTIHIHSYGNIFTHIQQQMLY